MANKRKFFSTKNIAYLGIMTALAVITNIFPLYLNAANNSVSFTYTIYVLSGIFFGPLFGFIVGLLSDILGFLIAPQGPFIPLITVASALMGTIAGWVAKKSYKGMFGKILLSYILIFIICTLGLNTVGLWLTYAIGKKSFYVYLIGRAPTQAIVAVINLVLTYVLYLPLKGIVKRLDRPKKQKIKPQKRQSGTSQYEQQFYQAVENRQQSKPQPAIQPTNYSTNNGAPNSSNDDDEELVQAIEELNVAMTELLESYDQKTQEIDDLKSQLANASKKSEVATESAEEMKRLKKKHDEQAEEIAKLKAQIATLTDTDKSLFTLPDEDN